MLETLTQVILLHSGYLHYCQGEPTALTTTLLLYISKTSQFPLPKFWFCRVFG